jgi:hypothetical protein
MADKTIKDKLIIDIAVLSKEITEIRETCKDHITNLDDIYITKETFNRIFYPYSENFGIDKNFISTNKDIKKLVSFLPEYRNVGDKKFYLLEEIISNIEKDLNVPRSCFTIESLVELTNQIIGINSLCDINCTNILSSLTWSNIMEIIDNYKLLKNENKLINPICTISIIFKTPTNGVENTIIRFNYKIINM